MDTDHLAELDAEGYTTLLAIAYGRAPKQGSLAYPHAFVCNDGATYWVKRFQHATFQSGATDLPPGAQEGLVAELVAGRLGSSLDAAGSAVVVEVPNALRRPDGSTAHLEGVGVGISDQSGMENLRYLADQVPGGTLDPERLDEPSVARVIAFQSWLGADDTQIMVDLRNGRVFSVDHGSYRAFSSPDPAPVVAPGLPPGFLLREHLMRTGRRDDELLFGPTGLSPFSPTRVTARADQAWKAAKLERIVLHEARHCYASYMIAAGVNVKALSTFMGHAKIAITLDLYGHLLPGSEDEAAGLLDAYLDAKAVGR